jgi:carboxymethylenebutenolidase
MPAYHARPKSADGPLPIVIVVQEIFGVHEHIRDLCRRLALEGYLAIAPELYFRQGDPNDYSDIPTLFSNLVSKVPDAQVLADLDHVASWAARNGGDAHRLLVTGFCWGGRISWLYAAHNPQLKAAVAWYGKLVGENAEFTETSGGYRHRSQCPGAWAVWRSDTGIPLDSVETMRHALRAANAKAEIVVYPDAGHAFNADYRPAITKNQPKMAGSECWRGLASTAVKKRKKARWRLPYRAYASSSLTQVLRRLHHVRQRGAGFRPAAGFQAAVRVHPQTLCRNTLGRFCSSASIHSTLGTFGE